MELITLAAGESRLTLAPEVGGSIVSWLRGTDILIFRPPLPERARGRVRPRSRRLSARSCSRTASIAGRMQVDGEEYQLPATFGGHAIHGVGWQSVWTTALHEPSACDADARPRAGRILAVRIPCRATLHARAGPARLPHAHPEPAFRPGDRRPRRCTRISRAARRRRCSSAPAAFGVNNKTDMIAAGARRCRPVGTTRFRAASAR